MDDYKPFRYSSGNDPRVELMGLRGSPLGEEIFQYLQQRQGFPDIRRGYEGLGADSEGSLTRGIGLPPNGILRLAPMSDSSTRLHEFSHAADSALNKQYFDRKTSWQIPDVKTPFTEGYEKLIGGVSATSGPDYKYNYERENLAKRLNPEWATKNEHYRGNNREVVGWGAGSTINSDLDNYKPPNHLNSTAATELSILLDLAMRADKPKPESPGVVSRIQEWVNSLLK